MDAATARPILVVDDNPETLASVLSTLREGLPGIEIVGCAAHGEFRTMLSNAEYQALMVGAQQYSDEIVKLLQEIKLKDYEPVICVCCGGIEPEAVAALYQGGCDQVLMRKVGWEGELAQALRHLLRLKRLEEENKKLLAKLTEANILLEEKNRRLDDFSATLAHDIRGPLGGVSMKLEYIVDRYEKSLDERCCGLLRRALQSTDRLTAIVQSMYDLARLGAKAAEMEEVDLNTLMSAVLADLSFDEKLDIKIGIGELPTVWGNPQLLQRVFMNLISNAVKYNDKREILINVGTGSMTERSIARFAEIYVQDNGRGIPADELKDIFTMFSRGSAVKEGVEGTGIGLAVVQRIAELHYGTIRVESEVGKGSTFFVNLPLEKVGFTERRPNLTVADYRAP